MKRNPSKVVNVTVKQSGLAKGAGEIANAIKTKAAMSSPMGMINQVLGSKDLSKWQKKKLVGNIVNKGLGKTAARAAMVASVSRNRSEAQQATAKYNYLAQKAALDKYNAIIKQKADPAEGTGEPEDGESTSVHPVGND